MQTPTTNETMVEISPRFKVKPHEIVHLQADVNYTRIFLQDASCLIVARTLGDFVEKLKPYSFFRVSRSSIINLIYVGEYLQESQHIKLLNEATLPISRRKQKPFALVYEEVCGGGGYRN